ncbi:MAG: glycosyltransferase family 4 protein [Bacteroidota bacterium]|nr:glycosyltransferase family 4 protein [Bacteroidota bacterium]
MKVFCYFVEPASYTVDLSQNIHTKHGIDFAFIKDISVAKSTKKFKNFLFLSKISIFERLRYIYNICKQYDVIIINGYNNYVFILTFLYVLLNKSRKYIGIESDTQLRIPSNVFKRVVKHIYLNFIFRKDYVFGFAGGSKIHKDLFRYYGMPEKNIFLIPMMVDNNKFFNNCNLSKESFIFLYVGRIIKRKNIEALIKCFLNAFPKEKAELYIVGNGSMLNAIKSRYQHERIIYTGELFGEDLINIFHKASVFVLPSFNEPWGLVINEALASGLPVIVNKEVGAVYDLVYDRETGLVFTNNDEMSTAMLDLYNNVEKFQLFSKNGVKFMRDNWNYDLYLRCLNNVIKHISL